VLAVERAVVRWRWMPLTEKELLAAWREGDTTAGTELFRGLFRVVRRFFFNKVPERDLEDLVQRTFTALVEGRDTFRGAASVRTYVLGIARNILLRYLRDYARRDSRAALDFAVSSIAALGVTPGTAIAIRDDEEEIRLALQRIPVQYQVILELSYWEGVSNAELAHILEIDPTTVRTRLFRARQALGRALEGKVGGDEDAIERSARALARHI
jgi:RNA polymerase sigma factor (sigma-70 family)